MDIATTAAIVCGVLLYLIPLFILIGSILMKLCNGFCCMRDRDDENDEPLLVVFRKHGAQGEPTANSTFTNRNKSNGAIEEQLDEIDETPLVDSRKCSEQVEFVTKSTSDSRKHLNKPTEEQLNEIKIDALVEGIHGAK